MSDIDKLSRKVPQLCKVAPSTQKYHMEDVHRAGGVIGILGELDRAGLLNRDVKNVLGLTLPQTLEQYDIIVTQDDAVKNMFRAGPAGIRTTGILAGLPLGYAGRRSLQWLYPLAGTRLQQRRRPGGALR